MSRMAEEQIEAHVERMMDHFDRMWLKGCITKRQYEQDVQELNRWAEGKYADLDRRAA